LFLFELVVQREMNLAWSFAQLHQSAVADNRRQPSGDLRLPPKLIYLFVSGQKGFLHSILCVSCIPQKSKGTAIKMR
jgi:hypothetical protein